MPSTSTKFLGIRIKALYYDGAELQGGLMRARLRANTPYLVTVTTA